MARFCCSNALGKEEFLANVTPYHQKGTVSWKSGVAELFEVLEELKVSERATPIRAHADRKIAAIPGSDLAHANDCDIWTLSPSDKQITKFLQEISNLMPSNDRPETKRRFSTQTPNHLAVVTFIKIGALGILLGADLEETSDPETGWSAIVNSTARPNIKGFLFKVPHHGSVNGHAEDVWTEMLHPEPISITTPYYAGRKPLPSSDDLLRISAKSGRFFVTSSKHASPNKRQRSVEKMIAQVGKLTSILPMPGILRLRNDNPEEPDKWSVELSEQAYQVNSLPHKS
jgi:hypothetical protein